MGFPRIVSKTNKIYTKLGEFCFSADGNQFWIICHTCQEELQTQDKFWKHIQDEHNFMHGIKHENSRSNNSSFPETCEPNALAPLALYRKVSVNDPQRDDVVNDADDIQKESKHYTEMRTHDDVESQGVASVDIKLEPNTLTPSIIAAQQQNQSQLHRHHGYHAQQQQQTTHMEIAGTPLMYQLPQVHPSVSAYAALVQAPTINTLNMTVAAAATAAQVPTSIAALLPQDLPKDNSGPINNVNANHTSNNINANNNANSAVSSDDGERWYICDFENCSLKFKYLSRLELHRSVHSKERRFACEICGASFKQSCNLSTHRKKKHALRGVKS